MTRRSVTLPPDLERAVRRLQARLLTEIDRDISFNETLNLALAAAFSVRELSGHVDLDQWSALLDGSEWQSNGTITEAGLQVLECIVPPSTTTPTRSNATRRPREKVTQDEVAEAANASVTPTETLPPSPLLPPIVSVGEPVIAASAIVAEPGVDGFVDEWSDQRTPTDVIVDEQAAETLRPQEERGPGALAVDEPLAGEARDEDGADDRAVGQEFGAPLLGRFYEPRVVEPVGENAEAVADAAPAEAVPPRGEFDDSFAVAVEPEETVADPEPSAPPERTFGGGMDLDALRQAIVAGETEPSLGARDSAARPQPPAPPRDATDFASMMAGYAPGSGTVDENEVIVPEIELPASDTAADADESPIPPSNDADAAAIGEDEEPSPSAEAVPDAEEPVVKPPADQAADYLDLDRALKDAAAAYEERLRNSGAS